MLLEPTEEMVAGTLPAASVLIPRDGARGLELLVMERARNMSFAGGAIVFPGGKVDASDAPDAPRLHGFTALPDRAARVTAAREAFEEAGVLLSEGPPVAAELRAMLRPLSDRHEIAFAALLDRIDHQLDAAVLKPFARWLPPISLGYTRFDTRFYLARLPAGESHLADGHEAVLCRWARPADLLAEADAGAISLLFPTRCILARVAQFASVDALWQDGTPAAVVQTAIDGEWLTIPEGLGYPYRRERLEGLRRG